MQTLLNYRIQSTSMVPLYNYNLNRNYISGYNYYPNLKMNSYIKDNTLDSSIHNLNSSFTTSQNIASQMSFLESHSDIISEHKISPYEQYRNIMENSLKNFFLNQSYISNIDRSKEEKKNAFLETSKANLYDNFSQIFSENRTSSKSIGSNEGVSSSNELSKFIKNGCLQNTNIPTAITLERNKPRNHHGYNNQLLDDGSPKTVSGASVINKLVTFNAFEEDHTNVNETEKDLVTSLDLNTTKLKDVPSCNKSIKKPLLHKNKTISAFETQTNESNVLTQIPEDKQNEMSNLFVTKKETILSRMDIKEKTPPFENINFPNSVQKNCLSKR